MLFGQTEMAGQETLTQNVTSLRAVARASSSLGRGLVRSISCREKEAISNLLHRRWASRDERLELAVRGIPGKTM